MRNPSAARGGSTVALAFLGGDAADTQRILGVALAPLSQGGALGAFRYADPVVTASGTANLLPRLVGRTGGYWLGYLALDETDPGGQGPIFWARLGSQGELLEGPRAAGLDMCRSLRVATSAASGAPPEAPDSLALVCAEGYLTIDWLWQGVSLHVTVAQSEGGDAAPVTLDECLNRQRVEPGVVWDGAAYDVIYPCERAGQVVELILARVDEAGQVAAPAQVVHQFFVDEWGQPGQVGATWDGSAIALVWLEQRAFDPPDEGLRFGRLRPTGEWVQAPTALPEGAEAEAGDLELVALADGYALLNRHCVIGLEQDYGYGWICGLGAAGEVQGCVPWQGAGCADPLSGTDLTAVPIGAGLRVFFDDSVGDLAGTKDALYHVGWTPPADLDGPPQPLSPPAGDLRPLALGGNDARALVLGVDPVSHLLASDRRAGDFHLYAVEPLDGTVQRFAPPALANRYALDPRVDADEEQVALLWHDGDLDSHVLTVLGPGGIERWHRDLSETLGPVASSAWPAMERDGIRVFYRDNALDQWWQLLVTEAGADPPSAVGDEGLAFFAGHAGVYYACPGRGNPASGALDETGRVEVQRFDPTHDAEFVPLAEATVAAPADAWLLGLAAGPGLVGALIQREADLTVLRWDPTGLPRSSCRLDQVARRSFTWTATDEGLGLLLYEPLHAELTPLLWLIPAAGPSRLFALELPSVPSWYGPIVRPRASSAALEHVWRDAATGDVLLSRWPWPQP